MLSAQIPGMLGWLRSNPHKALRLTERVAAGLMEIGVLLVAFAPLDLALNRSQLRDVLAPMLLFMVLGVVLFGLALHSSGGLAMLLSYVVGFGGVLLIGLAAFYLGLVALSVQPENQKSKTGSSSS